MNTSGNMNLSTFDWAGLLIEKHKAALVTSETKRREIENDLSSRLDPRSVHCGILSNLYTDWDQTIDICNLEQFIRLMDYYCSLRRSNRPPVKVIIHALMHDRRDSGPEKVRHFGTRGLADWEDLESTFDLLLTLCRPTNAAETALCRAFIEIGARPSMLTKGIIAMHSHPDGLLDTMLQRGLSCDIPIKTRFDPFYSESMEPQLLLGLDILRMRGFAVDGVVCN